MEEVEVGEVVQHPPFVSNEMKVVMKLCLPSMEVVVVVVEGAEEH